MNECVPMILSDDQLFKLCREYGLNAKIWLRKFAGLVPEIYRRRLYKRRGFVSIYEFAKKLAGMNERTVDKILNLSKKFEDKPNLREKLENGSVGWSKLEKVASVATKETEKAWAEKVDILGTHSLEMYVQEFQRQQLQNSGFDAQVTHVSHAEHNSPFREEWKTFSFAVSPQIEQKLRALKQRFEKEKKQALAWNEVMAEIIKIVDGKENLQNQKSEKEIKLCPDCVKKRADTAEGEKITTRYMPAEVRHVIQMRSGGKCEFQNCPRPGEIYHHTRRFVLRKNHDPEFIRFLCKAHEGILQVGFVENEEGAPHSWKIRANPEWWDLKNLIDQKVAEFRREPVLVQPP